MAWVTRVYEDFRRVPQLLDRLHGFLGSCPSSWAGEAARHIQAYLEDKAHTDMVDNARRKDLDRDVGLVEHMTSVVGVDAHLLAEQVSFTMFLSQECIINAFCIHKYNN